MDNATMTASAQLAAKDTSPDPILTAICTGVNNVRVKTSTNLLNITELREMIMDELDPLTMLNLVSTSRAALATFERYPLRYLNAAMEHVSLYFAEAIIEATRRTPSDDILLGPESVLFEDQPHSMTELDNSYASTSREIGTIQIIFNILSRLCVHWLQCTTGLKHSRHQVSGRRA